MSDDSSTATPGPSKCNRLSPKAVAFNSLDPLLGAIAHLRWVFTNAEGRPVPRPVGVVYAEMEMAGFDWRLTWAARQHLKVKRSKLGTKVTWLVPWRMLEPHRRQPRRRRV